MGLSWTQGPGTWPQFDLYIFSEPLQTYSFTRTLTQIIEGIATLKIVLSDLSREQMQSQIPILEKFCPIHKNTFGVIEKSTYQRAKCKALLSSTARLLPLALCLEQIQVKFLDAGLCEHWKQSMRWWPLDEKVMRNMRQFMSRSRAATSPTPNPRSAYLGSLFQFRKMTSR